MPRDGSGVHTLPSGYLAVTGEPVLPSNHNPPLEDLSASITESIARTGVTAITANIPFNDKRITGLGDATADTDALNRRSGDGRYVRKEDIVEYGLAASVSANALTIALKARGGGDPSSSDPAAVTFRSATAGSGDTVRRLVTAATTLVISSGSTMGFANATAGRIWIVAFDDAGTVRLGAINCRNGVDIFRLGQFGVASSTAEGGAGAADNAHVFYTGTAVTSKAYTVLGYFEWATGLTTAGTWTFAPDRIEVTAQGSKLPGDAVQSIVSPVGSVASGTGVIPFDNTIPQISEGNEFMTAAITPSSAANLIEVEASGYLYHSAGNSVIAALFRDSGTDALTASLGVNNAVAGYGSSLRLLTTQLAASVSSTTFRFRGGSDNAGTTTFNGLSGSQRLGGSFNSRISLKEIVA